MSYADPSVSSISEPKPEILPAQEKRIALIDGPYGGSHPDFAAFDTVLLISGSTGITFTLPVLFDIAHRASSGKLPVRHLKFVWTVKKISWISWVSEELKAAFLELQSTGVDTSIDIYVTKDNLPPSSQDISPPLTLDDDRLNLQNVTSFVNLKPGRPSFQLIQEFSDTGEGKMGVAVCGPVGMSTSVRNTVARVSTGKALDRGTGVQSITLHAECFSW